MVTDQVKDTHLGDMKGEAGVLQRQRSWSTWDEIAALVVGHFSRFEPCIVKRLWTVIFWLGRRF